MEKVFILNFMIPMWSIASVLGLLVGWFSHHIYSILYFNAVLRSVYLFRNGIDNTVLGLGFENVRKIIWEIIISESSNNHIERSVLTTYPPPPSSISTFAKSPPLVNISKFLLGFKWIFNVACDRLRTLFQAATRLHVTRILYFRVKLKKSN